LRLEEAALAKRKQRAGKRKVAAKSAPAISRESSGELAPPKLDDSQVDTSGLSLHELFAQQTMNMLDRADLDEEQKQTILIAMSCPCCGSGGLSFTAKLKRRT
jgi:DNA-binding transcriptional regulator YdaS (Cro superfamily)